MPVPKGILLVQGGRADMLIIGYVNGDIWHMFFGRQGGVVTRSTSRQDLIIFLIEIINKITRGRRNVNWNFAKKLGQWGGVGQGWGGCDVPRIVFFQKAGPEADMLIIGYVN